MFAMISYLSVSSVHDVWQIHMCYLSFRSVLLCRTSALRLAPPSCFLSYNKRWLNTYLFTFRAFMQDRRAMRVEVTHKFLATRYKVRLHTIARNHFYLSYHFPNGRGRKSKRSRRYDAGLLRLWSGIIDKVDPRGISRPGLWLWQSVDHQHTHFTK